MHHGLDEKIILGHAIDDRVREALQVELAILAPYLPPAFWFTENAPERKLLGVEKIVAQTRLALFIPKRGGLQLLRDLRMSDDAHRACA